MGNTKYTFQKIFFRIFNSILTVLLASFALPVFSDGGEQVDEAMVVTLTPDQLT